MKLKTKQNGAAIRLRRFAFEREKRENRERKEEKKRIVRVELWVRNLFLMAISYRKTPDKS